MKYKVGDTVVVLKEKEILKYYNKNRHGDYERKNDYPYLFFISRDMTKAFGKKTKIVSIDKEHDSYHLKLNDDDNGFCTWHWNEEVLIPYNKKKRIKMKIKY